jgi:hypothetical protein
MQQKLTNDTQPDHKNGHKLEPTSLIEKAGEYVGAAELPGGPLGANGDGSLDTQAERLADTRLQRAQRHILAVQIGQVHGNMHLQRVIQAATRRGSAYQNRSKSKGNGHTQEISPAGEITDGLDGSGAEGPLTFAGSGVPPNGNRTNGSGSHMHIQRQEDGGAEDHKPTKEERARALAAARAADQVANQAKSTGKAETAKSLNAESVEAQARKTAKAKAEQASAETKSQKGKGEEAAKGARITKQGIPPGKNGKSAEVQAALPGGEKEPAAREKTPASPEEDPAFQAVATRVRGVGAHQRSHTPAGSKVAEAHAASVPPANEMGSKAQANQVGEMEQAETPAFDAKAFKAQLMQRIQALAPKSMKEADEFKEQDKLRGMKGEMQTKVGQEKSVSQDPLKQATEAAPDPSGIAPKEVSPLPAAEPGAAPKDIGAQGAAPKPKAASEVEKPLRESSQSIDQEMSKADVTEEQLANSNEPEFQGALDSKREAQTSTSQAPQEYRSFEGEQVNQAQTEATGAAQAQLQAMHGDRAALLTKVMGHQVGAKTQDETARAKVAGDIQKIYDKTKTNVERILAKLDTDVDKAFDEGAEAAKEAFENYVDAKMEAYKEDRYGGWFGWARWAKDKLLGMPGEVNAFYTEGRNLFIQKMDAVINNIVAIVGRGLSEAKAEVANGKKEIQTYVEKLPADLRQVGDQAANEILGKFDQLESSIDSKQNELIERLATKYNEKLKAIDARIEELKAANQGLVDKAINAVVGVIKTILRLKDLLLNVLARISDVVTRIIKDPIGFLGNLISGVKLGLENFLSNLPKHLLNALVAWLTGALGPLGIKLPDDLFSLEGIFSLVMQILGLTWDAIRAKAVKLLGEPVVKALETGFEIFRVLISEGPIGLWKYVKEMFSNLKDLVIDAIRDMIETEVVQAGIKWIMGLLTPAGAFIKAAMAIYDIVKFFIEKASQIGDLINAIIDGIASIAGGAIGGAAKLIENALAKALPIVIGFLANLLGIGDLAKKVQGIIEKIRAKIDQGIEWVITKAKVVAGKLGFGKGKATEGGSTDQNAKARQMARERVANATQRPFKDEAELKGTIGQIEKDLIPVGLQSLQVTPRQGQAGQYDIIAREDVGDAQVGTSGGRVNVDSLRDYRPAWRESTKRELAVIYPEYHLSGTVTILFEKAMSKKGGLYNRALFDRRHITAYSDLRNDILNRLHGKKFDEAATMMQNMGAAPKSLNNESILEAIKTILSDKFNDISNLFVGDAQENQERGRQMADALTAMEHAAISGDVLAFNQAKATYLAQGYDPEPIDYFYDKYKSVRERL